MRSIVITSSFFPPPTYGYGQRRGGEPEFQRARRPRGAPWHSNWEDECRRGAKSSPWEATGTPRASLCFSRSVCFHGDVTVPK